jgi:hypothetical protein
MEQSPWELIVTWLVKKCSTFYEIWRFIIMFTRPHYWILSWFRWIQSTPSHPVSLRYVLILSCHLHLDLPSGLCGYHSCFITGWHKIGLCVWLHTCVCLCTFFLTGLAPTSNSNDSFPVRVELEADYWPYWE